MRRKFVAKATDPDEAFFSEVAAHPDLELVEPAS
jgi:hypothetical protein